MTTPLPTGQSFMPIVHEYDAQYTADHGGVAANAGARWIDADVPVPPGMVDLTAQADRAGLTRHNMRLVVPEGDAEDIEVDLRDFHMGTPADRDVAKDYLIRFGVLPEAFGMPPRQAASTLGPQAPVFSREDEAAEGELESTGDNDVPVEEYAVPIAIEVVEPEVEERPAPVALRVSNLNLGDGPAGAAGADDPDRTMWKKFKDNLPPVSSVVAGAASGMCSFATAVAVKAVNEEFAKPVHADGNLLRSRVVLPLAGAMGFGVVAYEAFRRQQLQRSLQQLRGQDSAAGSWEEGSQV